MNAIAISLYDKFDELAVLVDIIRHNWNDQYFISVCSNHPSAKERIRELEDDIDHFEAGAQIEYDDSDPGIRVDNNLDYRIYDSVRTSCLGALSADNIDYVMHLHADAWPLNEGRFEALCEEMGTRDASVAFAAPVHSFVETYPPGVFEDQFLVFDATDANAVDLFQGKILDFPPTNIHRVLPMVCITKFGWSSLYHYSNGSQRRHWDGTPSARLYNDARPMFYDPEHEQLHVAREDFPKGLGKSLQAHYLHEHNLTRGSHITELLDNHLRAETELFDRLDDYLTSLNDRLKWYGVSVDTFNRDIRQIEEFLEQKSLSRKVIAVLNNKTNNTVLGPIWRGLLESMKIALGYQEICSDRPYNKYPNQTVDGFYTDQLDEDAFPDELAEDFHDSFE